MEWLGLWLSLWMCWLEEVMLTCSVGGQCCFAALARCESPRSAETD